MKNIFRILLMALIVPFLLQSCSRGDEFAFSNPDPSFKLYNTTLSSDVLYPTMANNPFRLTWDNTTGTASEYTVLVSATEDFAKPVTLGKSTTNTYTTTIGALNTALLQAGYAPYTSRKVYVKVVSGSYSSNIISFDVTPYPTAAPVITAPTVGTKIVLDGTKPADVSAKITWNDYTYATDVVYLVEVAKKGSTNFTSLGSVNNLKLLNVTNKTFNDALMSLGLAPNVAADVDLRVTATTKSAGGTITQTSSVVTVNVTPYVSFKDMFLVGEATAPGWDPNNNNPALYRDPNNTNKFYYIGYFNAGGFKVIEKVGSWQPQWGQNNGVLASNDGTGSDPGVFNIPAAGYYRFDMDIVNKTYSITPYSATSATTYNRVGLVGSSTPNGWNSPDTAMTRSTFDPHQWSVKNIVMTAGEAKFRADDSWNVNWGSTTPVSGVAALGSSANIPVAAATYDVFFNDLDGSYIFVKK